MPQEEPDDAPLWFKIVMYPTIVAMGIYMLLSPFILWLFVIYPWIRSKFS